MLVVFATRHPARQPTLPTLCIAMTSAPAAAAEAERGLQVVAAEGSKSHEGPPSGGTTKRAKKPRIDLDDSIAAARAAMQKAQKEAAEARRLARNERRKKQRLVKKASTLSADDLERVAVLKRCGLANLVTTPAASQSAAASSSAGCDQPAMAAAATACAPEAEMPPVLSPAGDGTPGGSDGGEGDRS